MKILYDYQTLLRQKYGGISRYFYELAINVERLDPDVNIDIVAILSQNYYFSNYKSMKSYNTNNTIIKYIARLINKITIRFKISINNIIGKPYDIIHPTYYSDYFMGLNHKKNKLVLTVHDMTHEKFLKDSKDLGCQRIMKMKRRMILKADFIIAISENTKKDLLEFYPQLKEEKIKVIYHGYNRIDSNEVIEGSNKKLFLEKYVLFVGTRITYKNFINFLRSASLLCKEDKELKILCVGGGKFNDSEIQKINELELTDRIYQKYLNDKELELAYRNAQCFVFPSLYEGFGIPILEAFSNKCPVVLSNASCFPEIAMDAALYFDGNDVDNMASTISKVIYDNKLKEVLINKGIKRLKDFSWEETAKDTIEVYNKVLNIEV